MKLQFTGREDSFIFWSRNSRPKTATIKLFTVASTSIRLRESCDVLFGSRQSKCFLWLYTNWVSCCSIILWNRKLIGLALLLYPDLRLALTEYEQWWWSLGYFELLVMAIRTVWPYDLGRNLTLPLFRRYLWAWEKLITWFQEVGSIGRFSNVWTANSETLNVHGNQCYLRFPWRQNGRFYICNSVQKVF